MRKQWSFKALAVLLVLSLLITIGNQGMLAYSNNIVSVKASSGSEDGGLSDYITFNGTLDSGNDGDTSDKQDDDAAQQTSPEDDKADEAAKVDGAAAKKLYGDGMIHVFHFRQLQLIGTGAALTDGDVDKDTVGTGSIITDENGNAVIYSNDAKYFLEDDITLPKEDVWVLPDDFSGEFLSEERKTDKPTDETGEDSAEPDGESPDAGAKSKRLYDVESDTIYIQNVFQLLTLSSDNRGKTPVMTGDTDMETFGTGQLIYPQGEDGCYLTYSTEHNYVLSSEFSPDVPEDSSTVVSMPLRGTANANLYGADNDNFEGREYANQVVVKNILKTVTTIQEVDDGNGNKTYEEQTSSESADFILIGDLQQLEALNDRKEALAIDVFSNFNLSLLNGLFDSYKTKTDVAVYGPIYKVTQTRTVAGAKWHTVENGVELYYPGDADLVENFSSSPLYDTNNGNGKHYHELGVDHTIGSNTRYIYCAVDPATGSYMTGDDEDDENNYITSNPYNAKYAQDGNYIVFRDIDMKSKKWTPLNFSGTMYGIKLQDNNKGKLWTGNDESGKTPNININYKPIISHLNVVPEINSDDTVDFKQTVGVGFFGTLTGHYDRSNLFGDKTVVRNIMLSEGNVVNDYTSGHVNETVVSSLLKFLGALLGTVLDPVLTGIIGHPVTLKGTLEELLDARAHDPSALATGAFAGRIMGNVEVTDCMVQGINVKAVKTIFEETTGDDGNQIVGEGGFVGHTQGKFRYDGISNALQGVVEALSTVLNLIPGVGLGDLIEVLLGNALPVGNLIPTGYNEPVISNCTVSRGTLSDHAGKIGVGGFVGSQCGTSMKNCRVTDSTMTVNARLFGGGFAGVERDDMVKATLAGLGVMVGKLYPQSELVNCSITGSKITVSGESCLGGFIGVQANSYAIDGRIDDTSELTINSTGDCIGGFTGKAMLGTSFGLTDYLKKEGGLLDLVSDALTDVLQDGGADLTLLALGGVSQSGILGCQLEAPIMLSTKGDKIGGIVGSGEAVYIAASTKENLKELNRYSGKADAFLPTVKDNRNIIASLESVDTKAGFAGGIAGYMISANSGSLLGDTLGLKAFLGFRLSNVTLNGVSKGYTVHADGNYAGGAIGFAIGGDVSDVILNNLNSVTARSHAGGFVGTTGPDKVAGGNGLKLELLNIDILKIDNLLGMTSGLKTNYLDCTVNGVEDGFSVEATGSPVDEDDDTKFTAGGFAGDTTSIAMTNCQVNRLKKTDAHDRYGMAGGFVGYSSAGSLEGVSSEKQDDNTVVKLDQLLQIEADLIPAYEDCDVTFVDGGYVEANAAGGFTGEFRTGTVNIKYKGSGDEEKYVVHNVDHVLGGEFAGGFGGKVYSGALLRDGGSGLSLLGGVASVDITGLADITQAYVPIIKYAGVESEDGFSVKAAYVEDPDADPVPSQKGYAGGYIGYGSGVEVSYSHVRSLRNGKVSYPSNLEEKDGGRYMEFDASCQKIPYAVAGARYAGGYIGYMNVGSATALGDGLKVLGDDLGLDAVLKGLDVVTSTIEHSDVYGCNGGYSVLASSHVTLGDGNYDDAGIGYAGGFAGKMLGAHIQDSNADNFAYIIGEVAAGGYAGEMLPGAVADLLDYSASENGLKDLLDTVLTTDEMISLVQAFVPTIYNSRTTCIPCGGAVRAQSLAANYNAQDNLLAVRRGFAGGYVGHAAAAQIWGNNNSPWKAENDSDNHYTGTKRNCDAIRIRSVYGAEYAGGYVGLLEAGSTASTGGLSLLGGLISSTNVLGALNVVYPTIEYGDVYGPLEQIEIARWEGWRDHVAANGGFASELTKINPSSQEDLNNKLKQFIYGYHVVAGRSEYEPGVNTVLGGCAGGYAGAMHSGVIRYGKANNAKMVKAMRAAGGFAGEMQAKGLAEFGDVQVLNLELELGSLLTAANILVPVIYESGVTGYQNGLIVRAEGMPTAEETYFEDNEERTRTVDIGCGMAGGYVGASYGGQIGTQVDGKIDFKVEQPDEGEGSGSGEGGEGEDNQEEINIEGAWIRNLKTVMGTNNIGGFAGRTSAASIANVDDSEASNGLVQGLLDNLIGNPSDLVDVLDATIAVIGKAEVTAAKPEWGIVVDGKYTDGEETKYASCAGGFVGSSEASVFGNRTNEKRTLTVSNLRGVSGGHYVGGFFGLADVGSVAEVGSSQSKTNVLGLIQAGNVSLLDIFRTYIYHATVTGTTDGIMIFAHDRSSSGKMSTYQESGAAGGFGGGLMNGTVQNSSVSDLNFVESPNYSGGFIGICGTSSGISVNDLEAAGSNSQANLLTALGLDLASNPQLLNVVGSTVTSCSVGGFKNGFIARTTNIQVPNGDAEQSDLKGSCAAGFIGFADMAHIEDSSVTDFKYAKSPQTAGGFVGRTAMNYLLDVDVDSRLTGLIVRIVNALVKVLYLDKASQANVVNLGGDMIGLKLMSEGDLLYVNLFGLKIGASLCKNDPQYNQDAVIVTIGSSTIKLPCDSENGVGPTPDISITLIEGNRTDIKKSFVKGIDDGYNVYAGGADDDKDGTDSLGYAGGFIGYNDMGMVSQSYTALCDVIRGTPNEENKPSLVGPFIGYTLPGTRGEDYLTGKVEDGGRVVIDNNNQFSIYRSDNGNYSKAYKADTTSLIGNSVENVTVNQESCNRYETTHLGTIKVHDDFIGAVEKGEGQENRLLQAYVSPAMELLMLNVPLDDNGLGDTPITSDLIDPCDQTFDLTINKIWKDFVYLGSRPDHISVTIEQVELDTDPPEELVVYGSTNGKTVKKTSTVTLKNTDGSVWTSSWQTVVEDLPVANSQNGKYYQYVVNEVAFDNYTASYKIDNKSASADIINRYTGPLLPETGGTGVLMIYAIAIFLIVSGGLLLIIRMTPDKNKGQKKFRAAADVELNLSDFSDFLKYLKK